MAIYHEYKIKQAARCTVFVLHGRGFQMSAWIYL